MIFSFFYDLCLILYFVVQAPYLLRRVSAKSKRWDGIKARFFGSWPNLDKRNSIWIHAVSLGESKAIYPIIAQLQKEQPERTIVCTVQSDTAFEFLSKVPGIVLSYAPLDISWVQKRFVQRINPVALILAEGDFWYHQIKYAKRHGAKIALVSGKISNKTTQLYKKIPWIGRKFCQYFDGMAVQNDLYYERFAEVLPTTSKLQVLGNLKFAQKPKFSFEISDLKQRFSLSPDAIPLTIASTHECEEDGILNLVMNLASKSSSYKVFIAPRHPSRFVPFFDKIKNKLGDKAILFSSSSQITGEWCVCIIDKMGVLPDFFRISKVAIVAGSFDASVGGHNVLEPIQAGCPVVFGPHMDNQLEFKELILSHQAGWQLSLEQILPFLESIQNEHDHYLAIVENGRKLLAKNEFVVEQSLRYVRRMI